MNEHAYVVFTPNKHEDVCEIINTVDSVLIHSAHVFRLENPLVRALRAVRFSQLCCCFAGSVLPRHLLQD